MFLFVGTFLFFRHVDNSNPYPFASLCICFFSNTMIIASLLRFDRRFFNFIHFCFLRIKIYTFFARLDVYILLQSVFPCIINRNNYDLRD